MHADPDPGIVRIGAKGELAGITFSLKATMYLLAAALL